LGNITFSVSADTFDVLDTMITSNVSPSSCRSMKERSVEAVLSSLSLLSADDTKVNSNTGSTLDPSAPVFVPRQSRSKIDDDNETVRNFHKIKISFIYDVLVIFIIGF
jgi:hypothetical protein